MPGVSARGAPLGDASRAWAYCRRHPGYGADWRAHGAVAAYEPAAFPLRVQCEADLAAARWGLHAWEDPFGGDGPAAPFWCEAPVALAVVAPPDVAGLGEPLGALIAREGARPAGLRLLGGALLLECGFQSIPITHSIAFRSLIPFQTDHLFQSQPITDSSPIPITFWVGTGTVGGV